MNFKQRIGAVLLIITAALVAYWPALGNGFVWDDTALVLRDPLIRSWRLIPEGFRHFLFIDATGSNFYRPLQRLTFTADYALWGLEYPAGWHLTSILAHIGAALALFAMLLRWWGDRLRWWGLAVVLLWTIHPLHTSAVTYVAGRADPLAALCGFTAIAFALRGSYLIAGIGFLGAALSKESGAMMMAVWLVFLAWQRVPKVQWLKWLGVMAAVLAIYASLRFTAQRTPPPASKVPPVAERPVLAARALAEYAGLLLAPVSLRMERDVATAEPWRIWQTMMGVVLAVGVAAWLRWSLRIMPGAHAYRYSTDPDEPGREIPARRAPEVALALCAGAVAYLPISNVLPLNASVAEHWLYVPSAFLFAAVAATCSRVRLGLLGPVLHPAQKAAAAGLLIWGFCLAARTWLRQQDWHDQRTFILATIAAGGDSGRMRVNLGNTWLSSGEIDRALAEYQLALEREPGLTFAQLGIANGELRRKNYPAARTALEACGVKPGLEAEIGQLRTAIDFAEHQADPVPGYEAAAAASPLNWPLKKRAIVALAQTGRAPQAVAEMREFLDQQDFRSDSWKTLAQLLAQAGEGGVAAKAEFRARELDCRYK